MTRIATLFLVLLAPAAAAQEWTLQPVPTAADLEAVAARDADHAYAVADGGLLLSTTDGGATWAAQTLSAGLDLEGIAFSTVGVGVIATDDGLVYRTTDGQTWTPVATGAGDLRDVAWGTETFVFAAGRDGDAARSTDAGATWTAFGTGATDRTEAVAAVGENLLWVVGRKGEIRHSSDGGATWAAQASGTGEDLEDVQMLSALVGYIAGSSETLLKTTDGGQTWFSVSGGQAGGDGLFFLDAERGFVADDGGRIWRTDDGGATWTALSTPTSADFNGIAFADEDSGWAVGDGGAIVATGVGAVAGEAEAASHALRLDPVYPNPIAGRTTLRYGVARPGPVALTVHDVLGREVARLVDGPQAAGPHAAALDLSGLPAGVYFVRLAAGAERQTRRVVLVR